MGLEEDPCRLKRCLCIPGSLGIRQASRLIGPSIGNGEVHPFLVSHKKSRVCIPNFMKRVKQLLCRMNVIVIWCYLTYFWSTSNLFFLRNASRDRGSLNRLLLLPSLKRKKKPARPCMHVRVMDKMGVFTALLCRPLWTGEYSCRAAIASLKVSQMVLKKSDSCKAAIFWHWHIFHELASNMSSPTTIW